MGVSAINIYTTENFNKNEYEIRLTSLEKGELGIITRIKRDGTSISFDEMQDKVDELCKFFRIYDK